MLQKKHCEHFIIAIFGVLNLLWPICCIIVSFFRHCKK